MMAKMFYRFDEARQVLNMSDEQLRQLTREGKLREFRDGTQVMYKADQVDQLKRELGLGGDSVDLGPSDTGGPIGLVDSRGESAGGSVISLSDTTSKDDTASDMGLSGSGLSGSVLSGSGSGSGLDLASSQSNTSTGIGLASSTAGGTGPGVSVSGGTAGGSRGGSAGGSLSGSAGGSLGGTKSGSSRGGSGVSVLGLDEGGGADANAATAMGGSFGGDPGMEGMGSGSGLLDLSRERDDTSLGAPVLDQFNTGSRGGSKSGSGGAISGAPLSASPISAAARGGVPVYVEEASNFAGFAAGASAGAAMLALVALYCVAAAAMRAEPTLLTAAGLGGPTKPLPFLYVVGGGLALTLLLGVIGFVVGKRR